MKVSRELVEYENKMPQKIVIKRLNFEPSGYCEIEFTNWQNQKFLGIINDDFIVGLINGYTPYKNHQKYASIE